MPFAKLSGRGLGHTGGTLDKLESIPGFRVELDPAAFVRQVERVGLAVAGQSAGLVPADRRLYALRDVTATVDEISLIAASIMAKKIAAGADAILLDVKVGEGAFMKTIDDARRLAVAMLELGRRAGRRVVCELTRMDEPLGAAVGNALEVREALAVLRGEGPAALRELVLASAARLLALSDLGVDEAEGRRRAETAIASGEALAAYERWVRAQGGDPREEALPRRARRRAGAGARRRGAWRRLSALAIGRAAVRLGAGRARKSDRVDPATGVVCLRLLGDPVEEGEPLAEIHARDESRGRRGRDRGRRRLPDRWASACPRAARDRRPALTDAAEGGGTLAPCPSCRRSRRCAPASSRLLAGRRLERVAILDPRLTRPEPPDAVSARLEGRRVVTACAAAASTSSSTSRADRHLLVHLRMTGSFRHTAGSAPGADRHARAVVELDDGAAPRLPGRAPLRHLVAARARRARRLPGRASRAPSRSGPASPRPRFARALAGRRAPVKAALLDQRTVAGIGNIYADEALWLARLHPLAAAGELGPGDVARLARAIRRVLRAGIDRHGATLRDYRAPDGASGSMQEEFRVYGRGGAPCPRCGTPIAKARVAGRGTWLCPTCQVAPGA